MQIPDANVRFHSLGPKIGRTEIRQSRLWAWCPVAGAGTRNPTVVKPPISVVRAIGGHVSFLRIEPPGCRWSLRTRWRRVHGNNVLTASAGPASLSRRSSVQKVAP